VDLGALLEPFAHRGVDLGLDRLRNALRAGGEPETRFRAAQVAGTNGKGSICTFLHAILRAAGVHCGTYRSPHLVSWRERILIDDDWITAAALRADLERWQATGRQHALTPFELLTAAAFDRFALEQVEIAVLEVGLGGRLDATTVHPHRPVVGFATIGMDHREHLGDSLEAIAREKAAVMGPGAQAFSGPQPVAAAAVLEAEARRQGAELHWVEPLPDAAAGGMSLGLAGRFQRVNAAVAVAMARALAHHGLPIDGDAIRRGLAAARWPGRLEQRRWRSRPLLLDAAHNPPSAQALRQEIDAGQGRRWLIGIQRQKEAPAMLRHLLGPEDEAAIVPPGGQAGWSAAELLKQEPGLRGRLRPVATPVEGLEWICGQGPLPVVCGSIHLLGTVLPLLDG
jgi:dihydrofolate synthase/folylpolyglutamate synthase